MTWNWEILASCCVALPFVLGVLVVVVRLASDRETRRRREEEQRMLHRAWRQAKERLER
jgi:hypothetical protein